MNFGVESEIVATQTEEEYVQINGLQPLLKDISQFQQPLNISNKVLLFYPNNEQDIFKQALIPI